jgi:hypothetical protein
VNPFWGFPALGSHRRHPAMDNGELRPHRGVVEEIAPRQRRLCSYGAAGIDGGRVRVAAGSGS